jgi:hypothetical protein
VRRQRVLPVEVREDPVVKVADADKLVVDEDVAVVVQVVVDVPLVDLVVRKVLRFQRPVLLLVNHSH